MLSPILKIPMKSPVPGEDKFFVPVRSTTINLGQAAWATASTPPPDNLYRRPHQRASPLFYKIYRLCPRPPAAMDATARLRSFDPGEWPRSFLHTLRGSSPGAVFCRSFAAKCRPYRMRNALAPLSRQDPGSTRRSLTTWIVQDA
jgi:hypothetical protein